MHYAWHTHTLTNRHTTTILYTHTLSPDIVSRHCARQVQDTQGNSLTLTQCTLHTTHTLTQCTLHTMTQYTQCTLHTLTQCTLHTLKYYTHYTHSHTTHHNDRGERDEQAIKGAFAR